MTHADARALNKAGAKKTKGTAKSKLWWGVEIEVARLTRNLGDTSQQLPLITAAISFHHPGELVGEGLRIAKSLVARGHKTNFFIVDRAYSNGLYHEYTVPIRLLGFKHVFNYKDEGRGLQGHDPRGFIQVGGAWYLDNLPAVLQNADDVITRARAAYKSALLAIKRSNEPTEVRAGMRTEATKTLARFEQTYALQQRQRAKYRLAPKGKMADDWSRRYLIPTEAPGYETWLANPTSHKGQTVVMKKPVGPEANASNAGGLKHEQYYP